MIFSTEEGSTNADSYTIDYDDSAGTGEVILRFGTTVDKTISYDNNTNYFKLNDDVSFEENQALNFVIENNSGSVAICNASRYGRLYYDTSDSGVYICTSNGWEDLNSMSGLTPGDFLSSNVSDNYTGTGTLTFDAGTTLDINSTLDTIGATVNMDGINNDTFTLDEDGGSANTVRLVFGSTFAETIEWDNSNSRFNISDDLYVQGNLAITGTFTGDLAANTVETTDIQNYAITSVKISTGAVTADEIALNAVGASELADDAVDTNAIQNFAVTSAKIATGAVTSTEIALNAVGSSELADDAVDTNAIQNYAVIAAKIATGAVTTVEILDATILNADISNTANIAFSKLATRNKSTLISPEYPNFTLWGDSTNNLGTLDADRDSANNKNYYSWTSRKTVLNDYDIMVQFQIPEDFDSWQANAINVTYKTEETGTGDNALQIYVLDTTGANQHVTANLASGVANTWTSTNITSANIAGTYSAGDYMTIGIKLYSRRNNGGGAGDPRSTYAGEIKLNYVGR